MIIKNYFLEIKLRNLIINYYRFAAANSAGRAHLCRQVKENPLKTNCFKGINVYSTMIFNKTQLSASFLISAEVNLYFFSQKWHST